MTCLPAPMAKRSSVRVGDSEMMRCGCVARVCWWAAAERETTASAAARAATIAMARRCTNPPSHEGFGVAAGDRSSDSGLPPPPPSRVSRPRGVVGGERLPLQRRDRPGLAPEFPHRSPVCEGNLASRSMAGLLLALDLDGVLADTRPLWDAWLEDAARRARVELLVPKDREAAAGVLDDALGDWRPLLVRFASDRAPLWIRPRADTNAVLRRLAASGARIGVFSDAPREL